MSQLRLGHQKEEAGYAVATKRLRTVALPTGSQTLPKEAGMTMHQATQGRLPDRELGCTIPEKYLVGVRDDLGMRLRRADAGGADVSEADACRVAFVRWLVRQKLRSWGLEADLDPNAQLIVSELLTNALRYGDPSAGIAYRIVVASTHISIAVNGGLPYRPAMVDADADSESGRGMVLVAAISDYWGMSDGRTTTWCVLAVPTKGKPSC